MSTLHYTAEVHGKQTDYDQAQSAVMHGLQGCSTQVSMLQIRLDPMGTPSAGN